MALPVKLTISANHLPRDPGTCFVFAFDCGAVSDYLRKRPIDREVKRRFTLGSGEPSRNMQVVKIEDASFLRATPRHDVFPDGPWKNPTAVRAQQVGGSEWST
jgi:hypothetical protein